jgi:hypothetical protein
MHKNAKKSVKPDSAIEKKINLIGYNPNAQR